LISRFPPASVVRIGPVAQLGARFHGMEEVVGSIPTRSTITLLSIYAGFLHIGTFQELLISGACHKIVTNRMCTDSGADRFLGMASGLPPYRRAPI
jgi:hypothetical protein